MVHASHMYYQANQSRFNLNRLTHGATAPYPILQQPRVRHLGAHYVSARGILAIAGERHRIRRGVVVIRVQRLQQVRQVEDVAARETHERLHLPLVEGCEARCAMARPPRACGLRRMSALLLLLVRCAGWWPDTVGGCIGAFINNLGDFAVLWVWLNGGHILDFHVKVFLALHEYLELDSLSLSVGAVR